MSQNNIIQGIALVDMDGTITLGTEEQSQENMWDAIDILCQKANINPIERDIQRFAGMAPADVYDQLINDNPQLSQGIGNNQFCEIFRDKCDYKSYNIQEREGMLDLLSDLRGSDIFSALVTNSSSQFKQKALDTIFNKHSLSREHILPVTIDQATVLNAGGRPKPSKDPFDLGYEDTLNYITAQGRTIASDTPIAIIEDSNAGCQSAHAFRQSKGFDSLNCSIIQFVDQQAVSHYADFHVKDVPQLRTVFHSLGWDISTDPMPTPRKSNTIKITLNK